MNPPSQKKNWIRKLVIGYAVAIVLCIPVVVGMSFARNKSENEAREMLRFGDVAYVEGRKAEALALYREWLDFVEHKSLFGFAVEQANVIRKAAEHELASGNPLLARDWLSKGVNLYAVRPLLNMDSPEGKALLQDVMKQLADARKADEIPTHAKGEEFSKVNEKEESRTNASKNQSLVGVWGDGNSHNDMEFRANGDFVMVGQVIGTWKASGNRITIEGIRGPVDPIDYTFIGDSLQLKMNGEISTLTRK